MRIRVDRRLLGDTLENPPSPSGITDIREIDFNTFWFYDLSWRVPDITRARVRVYWKRFQYKGDSSLEDFDHVLWLHNMSSIYKELRDWIYHPPR
jgi:hypothetical protein